ncbi:hypothetical protein [Sinorhizobium meliloti]|uniref:hypothetical protein n=1 Tax=Rhizobium meliloti TaxID=382 RepID=UPI0012979188|nr:hypothetical protein [Sinorhizobium meliloti]MDW9491723.1 hypothetical protein [Sinorhizobium meliloti]MQV02989.1 hypothetical protein [Sinorhizobium meliloti]
MDIAKLSETRKADRAKIAELVSALCSEFRIDHSWTREGFDEAYPKAHVITIMAPRGLCVRIELDGESCQPNVHVLPWHVSHAVDTCLADAFGDINKYHFRKLTDVAYGTDGLLRHLRQKFELIKSGAAFSEEREQAHITESGTAAERMARWEEYRQAWQAEQARKEEVA